MKNTELKTRIIELADEMAGETMPELTDELFGLFEKNGNRLAYENVYFPRRKFLAVYGISAILFKRKEDIEKLEYVLDEICKEKTWALPAHCDRKKRPDIEKEIDLFNAETAGALSEILKRAKGLLDESLCKRVRNEIARRVLIPFASEGSKYGFENAHHNWNAVCCGSVGTALINIGEELLGKEKTLANLNRINASLSVFVDSFPEDGACLEGAGYFNYGIGFLTAYGRRYKEYMKKSADFFKSPKMAKISEFPNIAFFLNGVAVNFSDATENEKLHCGMLAGLQELCGTEYFVNENITADFDSDPCYRFLPLFDDLNYGEELRLQKKTAEKRLSVLPFAEWAVAENAAGSGFATKGGNNAEPHNHNDVGSYIYLTSEGTSVCELGAGEYTADYFGAGRYNILCNGTQGHSLPLIGGKGQLTGEEAKAGRFEVTESGNLIKVETDLTDCYHNCERVTRQLIFDSVDGSLQIRDEIISGEEISDRIISKKDITDKIEVLSEDFELQMHREVFNNHQGEEESICIFEIKEKKDGDNKKGADGKRLHSITYRLHP
ncbi:MAG: hypothetical protein K6F63_06775 [Lachnospiraceae bacterium]|nr:hypothetical protein [Lachnospiraceae bacterium]